MTQLDLEMLIVGLTRDAGLLGCAPPEQLEPYADMLAAALDEIARATTKAIDAQKAAA